MKEKYFLLFRFSNWSNHKIYNSC